MPSLSPGGRGGDLTAGTAMLLLVAMLLVDFVVSAFWYHQAKGERLRFLRAALEQAAHPLRPRADVCLALLGPDGRLRETSCPGVAPPPPHAGPSGAGMHDWRLFVVQPREGQGALLAWEAGRPLARQVVQTQSYVGVYILFNTLVLSTLAFFRHARAIRRPLADLARTAERVRDHEPLLFPEESGLSELHRLSFSLNRMLRRLERDRLDLQRAAAELADKNRQLLAQQREMVRTEKLAATGRLAAGLAHEIGNPLGVVQGYLELLGMPDCGEQDRREYVAHALEETRRMNRLVTMLLQAARHRPEQREAAELIDLPAFLAEFVEAMRPQSLFKNIALCLDVAADEARIEAPPDALRQVLLNAFLNAADAIRSTRESGGRIELGLRRMERDGRLWFEVTVADNGCGLAAEHADKIFDHFFTTKEPGAGTGLGLSVSLALVENMGGAMRAENREAGGMALRILLPPANGKESGAETES